ncbi:hypothetical protein [Streptomyces fractus]|uniref:hypothetical protein n=1 Tax=Streptomyces fractus TaxID=641806 RepID=UPI003CE973EA
MSDSIAGTLPWMTLFLASLAALASAARVTFPPPSGQHRRVVRRPAPQVRRPESRLDAHDSRLVRPYVIAVEQAARRRELLLADFGYDGPGPYAIHGQEVAA